LDLTLIIQTTTQIKYTTWQICVEKYFIVLSIVQSAYKLSEDFVKPYFHKYCTEIHDVTTTWKRNLCSFIVILNAFDVRPTCDTADVQAILPFPPDPLKHILCDVPDGSSDYRTISNVTFDVC